MTWGAGLEGYNDVVYPHQQFRSCADIRIVSNANPVTSQVYAPNPVKPASNYAKVFTCSDWGNEYGISMSPKQRPRQRPDKYKSSGAGLFCNVFIEDRNNMTDICDRCRQNCMTEGKTCPEFCFCTWFVFCTLTLTNAKRKFINF